MYIQTGNSNLRYKAGVHILQKEEDFVLGILGVLLGRIPGFKWNDHKILTILRKTTGI